MKQVRLKTFETNSSSSHSLIIVSKEDLEQWKKDKLFLYDGKLMKKKEIIEHVKQQRRWYYEKFAESCPAEDDDEAWLAEARDWGDLMSYEDYVDGPDTYEAMSETYTTKSGEEVVAICRYYAS